MNKIDLIQKASHSFENTFNKKFDLVSIAPGRINLIGEHTDYNEGLAMPIAINKWVVSCLRKSKKNSFSVFSINYNKAIQIDANMNLDKSEPSWIKLVYKIILLLRSEFNINGGAEIAVEGNIPIGCGLSSSAAFVVSITLGILELYNIKISLNRLAELSQRIEGTALGIDCGLLDYYSAIYSKQDCAMAIDFKFKKFDYIPIPKNQFSIIVINSLVTRQLANSEYKKRVIECLHGLEILKQKFHIDNFRDIDYKMLTTLEQNKILHNRLKHYIDENNRVREVKLKLFESYLEVGEILRSSHESLKTLYEVSCEEIDYIIDLSESFNGWLGGRIIGGGFGGCSIHLVNVDVILDYQDYIKKYFRKKYNYDLDIYEVKYSSGISIYNE